MLKEWKTLGSRVVYETPWLKVRLDTCELPSGAMLDGYHISEFPPIVYVIALTRSGQIVLVRQYRQGVRKITNEFPAGAVAKGESLEAAARRELLEETGYQADEFLLLGKVSPSPAGNDNFHHFYVAHSAIPVQSEASDDEVETTEVFTVSFAELKQMSFSGGLDGTGSLAGLYLASHHVENCSICAELLR